MFTKGKLMFLYAESLVHPGSGEGVGAIDLPIQRERITSWPIIQASGLKGAIREHFEKKVNNNDELFVVFGPDQDKKGAPGNPADNAGAISFTDAKVLLFPVRSLKGTFAYLTCPLAITRLKRDLETLEDATKCNLIDSDFEKVKGLENDSISDEKIAVPEPDKSCLVIDSRNKKQVILEEYALDVDEKPELEGLVNWLNARWGNPAPWIDLGSRICLVSNNTFKDFVEMSTEVITRTKINDETGTVQTGALWTEEYLPRETLLYSVVLACKPLKTGVSGLNSDNDVINYITKKADVTPDRIWLGGGLTIGRGALRVRFIGEVEDGQSD